MVDQPAKPLNPKQLVDEFKKSGEFDRLRRQLLTHFSSSDDVRPLMSRVEEIVREKLSRDERLEHKTREAVHSEVMQDMERYPIIERAVADLPVLKDNTLVTSIEQYVRNIVREESNENTRLWEAKPSCRRELDEEEENDASSDYTEDEDPDDDDLLIITDANQRTTTTTSLRSPEPESGNPIAAGEVLPNGRFRVEQREPVRNNSHLEMPHGPPSKGAEATNLGPHTPPWPTPQGGIIPSPFPSHSVRDSIDSGSHSFVGALSSDSFTGELPVDGVSVRNAHDTAGGGELASKELHASRGEQNIQRLCDKTISPRGQDEKQLEANPAHIPKSGSDDLGLRMDNCAAPPSLLHSSSPTHVDP